MLNSSSFATATDYIVKAKSLLSSFIDNEEVKELMIVQRLKELLPPDAALLLTEESPRFDYFVKHIQVMWKMVQSGEPLCAVSTQSVKSDPVKRIKCYFCGKLGHIARHCLHAQKSAPKNENL